jgi:hypothetical protein
VEKDLLLLRNFIIIAQNVILKKLRRYKMNKKELDLEKQLQEIKHKHKMEELDFERKCKESCEKLKHELELERQRIKNADIQRSKLNRY